MHWQTLVTASLVATGTHAGIGSLVAEGMRRNSPSLERRLQEMAKAELAARGYTTDQAVASVAARQATVPVGSTAGTAQLNTDGTINVTAWDQRVTAACARALSALPASSNPSGLCACYNLPSLDNTTGIFEADLRLYKLEEPSGPFVGLAPHDLQVGLQYHGASVRPIRTTNSAEARVNANANGQKNATAAKAMARFAARQAAGGPSPLMLLTTYMFAGQIDPTMMMGTPMSLAKLEELIIPTVTLKGVNAAGDTVSTNVSINEAAFVAGVFSDRVVVSDETLAQMAVDRIVAELHNGTVALTLPGTRMLTAPIGLGITSSWMVIGLAVYGFGTLERMGYAEAYKRALSRANKGAIARI